MGSILIGYTFLNIFYILDTPQRQLLDLISLMFSAMKESRLIIAWVFSIFTASLGVFYIYCEKYSRLSIIRGGWEMNFPG
jgi:hypothetical protein